MCWPARLTLIALTVLTVRAAHAADVGISVTGIGEAKAKPTSVELLAIVDAEAELTADALVKFNDARKKAMAALGGLKMANLKLEPAGMTVSAAVDPGAASRGMGGAATNTPQKTRIAEDIRMVLTGVDTMKPQDVTDAVMKLIDTGRDSGLMVGPKTPTNYYEFQTMSQNPAGYAIAQFRLDDASALREQAIALAMKDARERAEKLAALAGVTLGPVVSVSEDNGGDENARAQQARAGLTSSPQAVRSARLEEISVKVLLSVQFGIDK
jgi:uncharacterized protein YggE